ncbi:MOSC domain-containing protein [Candidatus Bipolaricaulota bacterium]|nr:MOSC domain-containing protein [Candidatus Bipolaricaulota bacterium]
MDSGKVVAVCVSESKGVPKRNVGTVQLIKDWGLDKDAHAGKWHRQVSLLAMESIAKMSAKGVAIEPGDLAENITTCGLNLPMLPIGTRLQLGAALVEVTQIGKLCHRRCAVYHRLGDCVMPREGIFARVLVSGQVAVGDKIKKFNV